MYHPWLRLEIKSEESKKREQDEKESKEKEESKVEESTMMDSNLKSISTDLKKTKSQNDTIIEEKDSDEWKKEQAKLLSNIKKVNSLSIQDDLGERGA